jgi:TRAP-type C4-dicarboxylate transport system permease small subunit
MNPPVLRNPQKSIISRLEDSAELVAASLTLLTAVLVFLGVILRNFFQSSPSWITEIPTYAFTWAIFLALATAFSRGPQLGLDMIVRRLNIGLQKFIYFFSALAMFCISMMLIWLGSDLTFQQFSSHAVTNTALRFPLWGVSMALPIGFLLLAIHATVRLRGLGDKPYETDTKEKSS